MIEKVVILGAGKVATALATCLHRVGITIEDIYCRRAETATELAEAVSARIVTDISEISATADLYIISVNDSAIESIAMCESLKGKFMVHTAGSIAMSCIQPYSEQVGVFYPLQTFSIGRKVDMSVVPFCIEASSPECYDDLVDLARKVSNEVHAVSSEQRLQLHLAAVFANNFGNHMVTLAGKLLAKYNLPSEMLRPLVAETAAKLQTMTAAEAQTGPALRGDAKTIEKHIAMLEDNPLMQKIYTFASKSIAENN